MMEKAKSKEIVLCQCGCGEEVKLGNRFIKGHNRRGVFHTTEHNAAISKTLTGRTLSPEHCAAISAAKKDVPLRSPRTSEHNAAISKAKTGVLRTSPSQLAADDAKRGGMDIVNHHYLYDHDDLSLNTVQMTRSDHMKLHQLLKKLGYIILHINLPVGD